MDIKLREEKTETVEPTGPEVDEILSSICSEAKVALRMGLSVETISGQIALAADEVAEE